MKGKENDKDKETETLISDIERRLSPFKILFSDDLEDFYLRQIEKKIETNIAAIDLVKRSEKRDDKQTQKNKELLSMS